LVFDDERAPAHGVTLDFTRICVDAGAAGEAEVVLKVSLLGTGSGEVLGAGGDLDDALLAFALLTAGRGDLDAEGFGAIEDRGALESVGGLVIQMKSNRHGGRVDSVR